MFTMKRFLLLLFVCLLAFLPSVGGPGEVPVRTPCEAQFLAGQVAGYCTSSGTTPLPVCCHYLDIIFNGTHGISCAKAIAEQPELRFIMFSEALVLKMYVACKVHEVVTSDRAPEFLMTDAWATCPRPKPCPEVSSPGQPTEEHLQPQQQHPMSVQERRPPQEHHASAGEMKPTFLAKIKSIVVEVSEVLSVLFALGGTVWGLYKLVTKFENAIRKRREKTAARVVPSDPLPATISDPVSPPACELTPCGSSRNLLPARE